MRLRTTKTLASAAAMASLSLLLAACGPAGTGESDGESEGGVDGSTISLGIIDGLVPQYEEYVAAYEEEFPDRKVEIVQYVGANDWTQQVATQKLGDDLPDIINNFPTLANKFAGDSVTQDIAPALESGLEGLPNNFLPEFIDAFRPFGAEDEVHGLPVSADVTVVFYNKTIFDSYGIAYPDDEWTWDEFNETAIDITEASGGSIAGVKIEPNGTFIHQPVIRAAGGTIFDPDSMTTGIADPAALEAWEILTEAGRAGAAGVWGDATLTFDSGRAAMWMGTRPSIASLKDAMTDEWDIAPVPTLNGEHTTGGGAYGLSVTEGANLDAAAAFLAWFFSEDGGMALAQSTGGVVPATASGVESGSWQDAPPPPESLVRVNQIATDSASTDDVLPGNAQPVYDAAVLTALEEVFVQGRSLEEAFGEAAQKVDDALGEVE